MSDRLIAFFPEHMDLEVIYEMRGRNSTQDLIFITEDPPSYVSDDHFGVKNVDSHVFDSSCVLFSIRDLIPVLSLTEGSTDVRLCTYIDSIDSVYGVIDNLDYGRIDFAEIGRMLSENCGSILFSSMAVSKEVESLFGCVFDAPQYAPYVVSADEGFEYVDRVSDGENIDVAWVGPVYEGTIPLIRRISKYLFELPGSGKITMHIIGQGRYMSNIDILEFSPRIRFAMCGHMKGEGVLGNYLRNNVDFIVSYGEYALNASCYSVPVFVAPRDFDGDVVFSLISDIVSDSFGNGTVIASRYQSVEKIIESIGNRQHRFDMSKSTYDYYCRHKGSIELYGDFRERICSSSMIPDDFIKIASVRNRLNRVNDVARKDYFRYLKKERSKIHYNHVLAWYSGEGYVRRFPVDTRVRIKSKIRVTAGACYGRGYNLIHFTERVVYRVAKHAYCKFRYTRVQHSFPAKLKRVIDANRGRKIKVAFIIVFKTSFPLRGVFDKMLESKDFDPYLIVAPNVSRTHHYKMQLFNDAYDTYSPIYGDHVIRAYDEASDSYLELGSEYPLVVFCNPYKHLVHTYHGHEYFFDKNVLTMYANYGYAAVEFWKEVISTEFYNEVWKVCVENDMNFRYLKRNQLIHGRNGLVTGYAKMDKLAEVVPITRNRKKILICPHHTVWGWKALNISNFLKYADLFTRLPKMFPDVDFIFRPHPLLFPNLIEYMGWSQRRVDEYLENLLVNENMSYSTVSDYSEEFMNSDAMIHDCASFTAEYLFTNNPCCYMIKSEEETFGTMLPFGKECLKNYYHAMDEEDIVGFIQDVVINGKDIMKEQRTRFVNSELRLNYPHVSSTIVDILKREFRRE